MEEAQPDQLELVLKTLSMQGDPESPYWLMGLEEGTDPNISADDQILTQYYVAANQANNGPVRLDYARHRMTYQRTWGGYITTSSCFLVCRMALLGQSINGQ